MNKNITTKYVSLKPLYIFLFIEMTLKHWKVDEIQLFSYLLTIKFISSSSMGRIKKPKKFAHAWCRC